MQKLVIVNSLDAWHCLLGCGNETRSDYGHDVSAFLVEGQHIHRSLWSALANISVYYNC